MISALDLYNEYFDLDDAVPLSAYINIQLDVLKSVRVWFHPDSLTWPDEQHNDTLICIDAKIEELEEQLKNEHHRTGR